MQKKAKTSRGEDKRTRIVEAATELFSRYGFKRTSLDLLASEAGVAKPTVYAYFADKEAIFVAVAEHVGAKLHAAAEEAAKIDAPIEDRLAAILSAKHTAYYELVEASPHVQELVDSQNRLAAGIVEKADRAYVRLIAHVIEQSSLDPARAGLTANAAAHLFLRASSGAAFDATSGASHRRHVAEIVRVLCLAMHE